MTDWNAEFAKLSRKHAVAALKVLEETGRLKPYETADFRVDEVAAIMVRQMIVNQHRIIEDNKLIDQGINPDARRKPPRRRSWKNRGCTEILKHPQDDDQRYHLYQTVQDANAERYRTIARDIINDALTNTRARPGASWGHERQRQVRINRIKDVCASKSM